MPPTPDPVPASAWPTFAQVNSTVPGMPAVWSATAILHPFSPPQSNDPNPATPFFELCVASLIYVQNAYFSAMITGCVSNRTWWYLVQESGTQLSVDRGLNWNDVDMGWSLPTNWFGGQIGNAQCSGAAPLNWMNAQVADWWRVPVPQTNPPAATWAWFDHDTQAPLRMMFGQGPVGGSEIGDPSQLAILQMYSFSYFASFGKPTPQDVPKTAAELMVVPFGPPSIQGFAVGNPNGYQNFVFAPSFGMTAFMTPVNEEFNPLPTRVLYVWKPDDEYGTFSDRAQNSLMAYTYNNGPTQQVEALLTGRAPAGFSPPPGSDTSYLIKAAEQITCVGPPNFDFPQEAPDWISSEGLQTTIYATISANAVLCPGTVVTIFGVLFPPAPPNYPDSTFLWTWYAPQNATGTRSRPVTFMQSQSGVGVGTSLALADYYYHEEFTTPIPPQQFTIPAACVSSPVAPPAAAANGPVGPHRSIKAR